MDSDLGVDRRPIGSSSSKKRQIIISSQQADCYSSKVETKLLATENHSQYQNQEDEEYEDRPKNPASGLIDGCRKHGRSIKLSSSGWQLGGGQLASWLFNKRCSFIKRPTTGRLWANYCSLMTFLFCTNLILSVSNTLLLSFIVKSIQLDDGQLMAADGSANKLITWNHNAPLGSVLLEQVARLRSSISLNSIESPPADTHKSLSIENLPLPAQSDDNNKNINNDSPGSSPRQQLLVIGTRVSESEQEPTTSATDPWRAGAGGGGGRHRNRNRETESNYILINEPEGEELTSNPLDQYGESLQSDAGQQQPRQRQHDSIGSPLGDPQWLQPQRAPGPVEIVTNSLTFSLIQQHKKSNNNHRQQQLPDSINDTINHQRDEIRAPSPSPPPSGQLCGGGGAASRRWRHNNNNKQNDHESRHWSVNSLLEFNEIDKNGLQSITLNQLNNQLRVWPLHSGSIIVNENLNVGQGGVSGSIEENLDVQSRDANLACLSEQNLQLISRSASLKLVAGEQLVIEGPLVSFGAPKGSSAKLGQREAKAARGLFVLNGIEFADPVASEHLVSRSRNYEDRPAGAAAAAAMDSKLRAYRLVLLATGQLVAAPDEGHS